VAPVDGFLAPARPDSLTRKLSADPFSDPFTDEKATDSSTTKDYVHIRIQQRNGRKSLTTVQVRVLD
jgi:translation initiation factor SUI1